jgi:hypothetical protein
MRLVVIIALVLGCLAMLMGRGHSAVRGPDDRP